MSDRLAALLSGDAAAGRNPFMQDQALFAGGLDPETMALARAAGFSLPELVAAGLSSLVAGGYQSYDKQASGGEEGGYGNPVFGGARHNFHHMRNQAIQQALAAKVGETVARNTPVGFDMSPREARRFPFALNSDIQFPAGIIAGGGQQISRIVLVKARFYKYVTGVVSVAFTFQGLSVGVDVMSASLDPIDASTFGAGVQENGVDFKPCEANTPVSVNVFNGGTATANYRSTLWAHIQK
jgi:hypothetical protein